MLHEQSEKMQQAVNVVDHWRGVEEQCIRVVLRGWRFGDWRLEADLGPDGLAWMASLSCDNA